MILASAALRMFGGRAEAHAAIPVGVDRLPHRYRSRPSLSLAEGEDVRLDARIEEHDLERAVRDRSGLAHQLI